MVRTVAFVANMFEFATSVVALTPIEFTARLIGAAVWVRAGGDWVFCESDARAQSAIL